MAFREIQKKENEYFNHRILYRNYYDRILEMLIKIKPDSIIEVGGGHFFISALAYYPCERRLMVDMRDEAFCGGELMKRSHIDFLHMDILAYPPAYVNNDFDVLVCSQVLEHVEDPKLFLSKIFKSAKVKIFSVPFKWNEMAGHLHDNIDKKKFLSWFPCKPAEVEIVEESNGAKRIVGVWIDE